MVQRVVQVRELKSEDMHTVYDIERKSFRNPYPLSLLKHLHNLHPNGFLVAELEEKIVGYVIGFLRWGATGHILALAVDPPYRRRGIGSTLMADILERLRREGGKDVRLEVRASNQTAREFYRKLGFKRKKMVPAYYSDGETAVVMVNEL